MSGRKRDGPSSAVSGGVFGGSTGSLTASLFGISDTDATGIFGDSGASFAKVVQDRVDENEAKVKKLKVNAKSEKQDEGGESIHDVLERRKRQVANSLLGEIACQAIHPANESKDAPETDADREALPIDVQIQETADVIRTHGFAIIENAVSRELLDTVYARANEIEKKIVDALDDRGTHWRGEAETFRFYEVASRCSGRMDSRYETSKPPFSEADLVENQSFFPIVHSLLGGATARDESHMPCLVYVGLIFSFPGSVDQPWHQDGMPLFTELSIPDMPPYALNIFIPLTDHDMSVEAGPTEFLPASHRLPEEELRKLLDQVDEGSKSNDDCGIVSAALRQGDALIYDYRVCHRGTSNLTNLLGDDKSRVRKILYLMYARPWFKEHLNFGEDKLF